MMPRPRDHQEEALPPPSPATPTVDSEVSDAEVVTTPRIRFATVFDAVAGRLSTRDDAPLYAQTDDSEPHVRAPRATRHPTRNTTLAPEEVLFRRKEAPLRWPHHDIYMAHERDLPNEGRDVLPSSDLLKSVHSYASHFYDALADAGRRDARVVAGRSISEKSMDETALLALGILLEEAGREILGARGDMVFTEREEALPGENGNQAEGAADRKGALEPEDMANLGLSSGSEPPSSQRGPKRRKVSSHED